MFSEVITDGRYGWATECEKAFGTYPVPIVHEWNTIAQLDVVDWGRNPAAAEFGRYGMLNVHYGKAKRGQPPRRRNVA
jgi:hypothetical protein